MNPEKKKELAQKALAFMDYNGKNDQEDIEIFIQDINEGLGMLPHINIE